VFLVGFFFSFEVVLQLELLMMMVLKNFVVRDKKDESEVGREIRK
jgi:hypothetical protein